MVLSSVSESTMCVQGQYLLGLKGPAQCVNFDEGPMKVHLIPRNGGKPIVSLHPYLLCPLSAIWLHACMLGCILSVLVTG